MRDDIALATAGLATWLETMRQPGGYGGPVAHWWQNRYRYTGPGRDWRYEGILIAYASLFNKTTDPTWQARLERDAADLIEAQDGSGNYPGSRFEINPGTVGTPHEAAATLGLLSASAAASAPERLVSTAKRNLDSLIAALFDTDSGGFNDAPGVLGRVPNKLATLAHSLLTYAEISHDGRYLDYARSALDDVLRFQVHDGLCRGAIHQYSPGAQRGDGRFFPYYNARCIPPLLLGARLLGDDRYQDAASAVLAFLDRTMDADGGWPQIVYQTGGRASWPRWIAGVADILLAYLTLDTEIPAVALERLLGSQLSNGAFPTAHGFASQIWQRPPPSTPSYRDVTPVVGWNDKVFRLFTGILKDRISLPKVVRSDVTLSVMVRNRHAVFRESDTMVEILSEGETLYRWCKDEPWASVVSHAIDIH